MMFPNRNRTAIRKLVERSLKSRAARYRYVVLAIALTTWLLTSVFSIGMGYVKSYDMQEKRMLGTAAHALLKNPTDERLKQLDETESVGAVGMERSVGIWQSNEGEDMARLSWYDEAEWSRMKASILGFKPGDYPKQKNEVIVPSWMLDELGIDEPKIGMEISLQYRVIKETTDEAAFAQRTDSFALGGWYTDYPHLAGRPGSIIVSRTFAEAAGAFEADSGQYAVASIQFNNTKDILGQITELERVLGLPEENKELSPVRQYTTETGSLAMTYAGIAGIVALIMLSGYLLIYNVLYVSVAMDTKQYGLLKTIGATQKQIRQLVTSQANRLAVIGILTGLALGAATSFVAVPLALSTVSLDTGVELSFHPVIFVGAALFAWLTTLAGARKPARVAGRISPIEASRYAKGSRKRGEGGAKLHRMAMRNLFRDKKRAVIVFLSLVLGMTTFLTVNTLVLSMNTDRFIDSYVENDFEMANNTFGFDYQGEASAVIDEEWINRIARMDGVKEVRSISTKRAYMRYSPAVFGQYVDELALNNGFERPSDAELSSNPEGFSGFAAGLDSAYVEELNKSLNKAIDIERFERGEIVLVNSPEIAIGAQFELGVPGLGKESMFEAGGYVDQRYQLPFSSFAPNVFMSTEAMKQWLGEEYIIYRLDIQAEEKFHEIINERLEALIAGNNDVSLSSKLEWTERMKSAKIAFYVLGGAVSLILASIGILNFASTMLTGIVIRRQEFAVMESIGMTRGQLRRLLLLEGAGYAGISLLLISTLGTLISWGAFSCSVRRRITRYIRSRHCRWPSLICLLSSVACSFRSSLIVA